MELKEHLTLPIRGCDLLCIALLRFRTKDVNLPNSPFHPPAPPPPRPALSLVVTMRRDRAKMLTYRWDPHPATLLDHLHSQLAEEGPKQVRRVFVKHA